MKLELGASDFKLLGELLGRALDSSLGLIDMDGSLLSKLLGT